jgi:hypothetical protein
MMTDFTALLLALAQPRRGVPAFVGTPRSFTRVLRTAALPSAALWPAVGLGRAWLDHQGLPGLRLAALILVPKLLVFAVLVPCVTWLSRVHGLYAPAQAPGGPPGSPPTPNLPGKFAAPGTPDAPGTSAAPAAPADSANLVALLCAPMWLVGFAPLLPGQFGASVRVALTVLGAAASTYGLYLLFMGTKVRAQAPPRICELFCLSTTLVYGSLYVAICATLTYLQLSGPQS